MSGSQECPLFSSCFFPPNLCHSHPVTPPSFPRAAAACGRFSCPAAKANHIASARCKAPRAPFSTSLHWDRGTEKPMLLYLQIFMGRMFATSFRSVHKHLVWVINFADVSTGWSENNAIYVAKLKSNHLYTDWILYKPPGGVRPFEVIRIHPNVMLVACVVS